MARAQIELPNGAATSSANSAVQTQINFMTPGCVMAPNITAWERQGGNGVLVPITALPSNNSVWAAPASGVAAVSFYATISASCDDQYMSGVLTSAFKQADQPTVPTSSCPCWSVPSANGTCPGIMTPITLSTNPAAGSASGDAVSYQQCVDPANFDY